MPDVIQTYAQLFAHEYILVCTRITEPAQKLILDSLEFKISQDY